MFAVGHFKIKLLGLAFCAAAVLAVSGCSLMGGVELAQPTSNNRIYLGDEFIRDIRYSDLDRYTCGARGPVYCEEWAGRFDCHCAPF